MHTDTCATRREVGRLTAVLFAIILAGPLVRADPPGLNPFPGVAPDERGLRILNRMVVTAVNDKTGEPMPGVEFDVKAQGNGRFKKDFKLTTGDAGQCTVEFPPVAILTNFRMDATAKGMVPIHINWTGRQHQLALRPEYVVRFQPGTTVGGTIRNPEGAAVPDASVQILIPATDSDMHSYYYYVGKNIRSGPDGRWRCDTVPAEMSRAIIHVIHGDFLRADISETGSRASLRDLSNVTVLARGPIVTGQILNTKGEPVANAKIMLGNSRYDNNSRKTVTDDDGRFELKNCQTQPTLLVVQADSYAPALQNIVLGQKNEPLSVRLGPPSAFRLRIVDGDGEPVQGVNVQVNNWRNHQLLEAEFRSDREGRVAWESGPNEEVAFGVYPDHGLYQYDLLLKPGGEEHTIVVYPKFEVHGTVDDAETGQQVPNFKVMKAWSLVPKPNWDRYQLETYTEGQFTFKFEQFQKTYRLRIEAEGYEPAESPDFTAVEHPGLFDFKLRKQPLAFGVILKADGSPAAGASVVVLAKSDDRYVNVTAGAFRSNDGDESFVKTTGADGRFSFAPTNESFQIVATHETGYTEAIVRDLADMPQLKLQTWGRIEGSLKAGTKPVVNEQVQFQPDRPPFSNGRIYFAYTAHTDQEGHFTLERVVPASGKISQIVTRTDGTYSTSAVARSESIRVKPGETTGVEIGGRGRPVVGRVAATNADGTPFNWVGNEFGSVTPGILGFNFGQPRQFVVAAEGTFRVEDLPAGQYQLTIPLTGPTIGRPVVAGSPRRTVKHSFTIPKIEGGRSDEPLDLGVINSRMDEDKKP